MLDDMSEIEKKLISFSEKNAKPSLAQKIDKLLPSIEKAIADGLTLDLLTSFLNQQGIKISKNTLKVTIYRLRKKRAGNQKEKDKVTSQQPHTTSTSQSVNLKQRQLSPNEQAKFHALTKKIEAFNAATGWVDRYVALGGDINDIKDQSESQKRQMTMKLKSNISRELTLYR